jgi:hypothetical protein
VVIAASSVFRLKGPSATFLIRWPGQQTADDVGGFVGE